MATTRGRVENLIQIMGKDLASKEIDKSIKKLTQLKDEAGKVSGASSKAAKQATTAFERLKNTVGGTAAKMGLATVALAGAAAAGKALFDGAKAGAAYGDMIKSLGGSIKDVEGFIRQAADASAGMISDPAIAKSAAMFRSFGLDLGQFSRAAGVAAKTSIATGEGTEFLMDSIARGVSRMSAPILDNLGIVIKISDAKKAAAAASGKLLKNVTDEEAKAALLTLVLERLEKKHSNIDPVNTQTAAIAQLEIGYKNLKNEVAGFLAGAAVGAIEFFTIHDRELQLQAIRLAEVAEATDKLTARIVRQANSETRTANIEEKNAALAASAKLTDELADATGAIAEVEAAVTEARASAAAAFGVETEGMLRHLNARDVGFADVAERNRFMVERAIGLRAAQNEAGEDVRAAMVEEAIAFEQSSVALDENANASIRRMMAARGMTDAEIDLLQVERLLTAAERDLAAAVKKGSREMVLAAKERRQAQLDEKEGLVALRDEEKRQEKRRRKPRRKKSDEEKALGTALFSITESKEFKAALAIDQAKSRIAVKGAKFRERVALEEEAAMLAIADSLGDDEDKRVKKEEKILEGKKAASEAGVESAFQAAELVSQAAVLLGASKQEQAFLDGLIETARAIQSGASLDFIGAAAHGLAAGAFFKAAGSGGGGGASAAAAGGGGGQTKAIRSSQGTGADQGGGPVTINFAGFAVGTPQQLGSQLTGAVDSIRGTGMGKRAV